MTARIDSPKRRVRRWAAVVLGSLALLPAADVRAAPATDEDAGANIVLRDRPEWESADAIEAAVQASDGRPTLVEFYAQKLFA